MVIAAGALERPLVFSGNDRPGVMLADAARIYLQRYGVKVGARAVITTSDDTAYAAGVALREAGVVIGAVADVRGDISDVAEASGLPVRRATSVVATSGRQRVNRAILSNGDAIPCDLLLMCGGWTPSVHLFSQSRAKLRFDERLQAFLPGEWTAQVRSVGACNGTFGLAACLEEGYAAGDLQRTIRGRAYTHFPAISSRGATFHEQRQGICRFPERRDSQGPCTSRRRRGSARSSM